MPQQDEGFFIGELAARTGASRDTIRFYESSGVLPDPARSGSGYRVYHPEDVERLNFIEQAKRLGLSLAEIADTLEIVDAGREPCDHVRRTLEDRLGETRRRIGALRKLESKLEVALARARDTRAAPEGSCRCPIIEVGAEPATG